MVFTKIVFIAPYIYIFSIGPIKALRKNYYVRINYFSYVRGTEAKNNSLCSIKNSNKISLFQPNISLWIKVRYYALRI